ncbi:glycoside hydrolase family 3 N-terminal domain-containing protein [Agathobaculum sp. Marseille-P7918]|uniref:glycoside hydrolase family 3 N-terminal domain-containing protein n=1 Tax=Agathobaculum sp. Marseille-P7918 TaxID=2479843 RepID=UPI00356AC06F
MKKRLLCLLLALALPLGLTACSEKPGADATAAQTAPEPTPEPPQPDPAEVYADSLTLEQQVAQLFFARCPDVQAAELAAQYDIGGYILFGRDFENQTPDSLRETIASYQQAAATPMLIGVDEEGGTVVRVSAYPAFRAGRFQSPQALFAEGGLERIQSDTKEKDTLLASLGINVNLAPVCDVSTSPSDFINARAFGQDAQATSDYVRTVVEQMKTDSMGMVLKHFPGYGSNVDTHTGIAQDNRPLEQFRSSDFLPFTAGIEAGAQAILVCHNIVSCMDGTLPASLSPAVHQVLREELGFDGVVMTDDLVMQAITDYTGDADAAVLAVQAGNDMLISSDFVTQYNAVLTAVQNGTISETAIRDSAVRVLRWKIELGLIDS